MLHRNIKALRRVAAPHVRAHVRAIYYGVNFPVTHAKIPLIHSTMDDRSTSETAKDIFAHAIGAVDPEHGKKVMAEKDWRNNYTKHVVHSCLLGAKNSDNALKIAKAGIDEMYDTFEYFNTDGSVITFKEALQTKATFHTGTVKGTKAKPSKFEVKVPYKCFHTGEYVELRGQALMDQVDRWAEYGTIEPDAAAAIKEVVKNPEWLDLSDQTFVILGATSAMGPFHLLMELGAHIVAVDIDKPAVWRRLIEEVYYNSNATITFPMHVPYTGQTGEALYKECGANIIRQTPEVRNWVKEVVPKVANGKPVTIGAYAYLDGELHVRVNLACDAIMDGLAQSYGYDKVNFHYLPTPTDAYVISDIADQAVKTNLKEAPSWQKNLEFLGSVNRMVPMHTLPTKGECDTIMHISDSLMVTQGPNYALAKRLQQWRCILARKAGSVVSFSIAPATATASVLSNKIFAAAYGGAHHWKPVELSNAVMGYLLIHDIQNPKSVAHPNVQPEMNPMLWLSCKAFHGGFMRCAYKFTSITELAAIIYLFNTYIGKYLGMGKPKKPSGGKAAGGH